MKITVVFHSADFDGLFCEQIARKFLGDQATYIGWNFGDDPLPIPDGTIYVMDLPVDRVFGFEYKPEDVSGNPPQHPDGLIWIDHHRSSIATHPATIPGYRIDGVAACRLAWQWFANPNGNHQLPEKHGYVSRLVSEPLAVRLAGEYDIWDKRDPRAELFQHGLRSRNLTDWDWSNLLDGTVDKSLQGTGMEVTNSELICTSLLSSGNVVQYVRDREYAEVIAQQGFDAEFEGLKFLCCCSHELDIRSQLFAGAIRPEHDALCGFTYTGKGWRVSLYHAPGHEHHDLSVIAKKYGGGGHAGAAGMNVTKLPFNIINA